MEDYNKTEKIIMLIQKLASENAPGGFKPSKGDLTFYEPCGNLALFYKDYSYSNRLISLGRITSGSGYFQDYGTIDFKFKLIQ